MRHIIFTLLALAAITAQAQTDVTATYLTNPSFESSTETDTKLTSTTGWTIPTRDGTYWNVAIGGLTNTGSPFGEATAPDGSHYLFTRLGWVSNQNFAWNFSAATSQLPAGKYRATIDFLGSDNGGGNSKIQLVVNDGTANIATSAETQPFPHNADNTSNTYFTGKWGRVSVDFTVSEAKSVTIAFNTKLNGNQRSDFCIDNLRLYAMPNRVYVDKTSLMTNAAITNADGWTNGASNSGQQYYNAPDNAYLDYYNTSADTYQDVAGLPAGKYIVKAATRAHADVTDGYIYTKVGDVENKADVWAVGNQGNGLAAGWYWTETPEIELAEGQTLRIGLKADVSNARWVGADDFKLYLVQDPAEGLRTLITTAQTINTTALNTRGAADLAAAITAAQAIADGGGDYAAAVDALNAAMTTANAIIPVYAAYKATKSDYDNIATADYSLAAAADRSTFTAALATAATAVEAAATAEAIAEAAATMTAAYRTYANAAYPAQGKTFDMTHLFTNAAVANGNGWTGASINNGEKYDGAPDDNYLDVGWNAGQKDIYADITGLRDGNYSVKAATRAHADVAEAYIYVQNGAGDKQTAQSNRDGATNGTLGRGWSWTTTPEVSVADGTLRVGFYVNSTGQTWAGADDFHLLWTYDFSATQTHLANALAEAQILDAAPISAGDKTALEAAINAAQNVESTPQAYNAAIAALEAASQAVKTWRTAYEAAKAPLVAGLETFAQMLKDDGTPKEPMSDEAWNTLLAAVNAATAAKDVADSYDGFAAAAAALNTALNTAADATSLYSKYANYYARLNALSTSILAGTTYTTATDADINTAIADMNTKAAAYLAQQSGNVNVGPLLGDNLDFETSLTTLSWQGSHVYDVPGWNNHYYTNTSQPQYAYRELKTADSGAPTANQLRMRSNWGSTDTQMQISKTAMLPQGRYTLTLYIKKATTNNMKDDLCYYAIDGTRQTIAGDATWQKQEINFTLTQASAFDLSLGYTSQVNNGETEMFFDDITLTYLNKSPYATALEAAQAHATHPAITAALSQYAYTEAEQGTKTEAELTAATATLNNAITIADNNGEATSLWTNADFKETAIFQHHGSGGAADRDGHYPAGWTWTFNDKDGWHDTFVANGDFNFYIGTDCAGELSQQALNLPRGTYRFSADVATHTEAERLIAIYGATTSDDVYRSHNIRSAVSATHENNEVFAQVLNGNDLTIGIRSDNGYFEIKNIRVEYVADDKSAELDGARLYQDVFCNRGALSIDLSQYTAASGCTVEMEQPNAIIIAATTQAVAGDHNVIAGGTCASLVLTDGNEAWFNNASHAFTATRASYTRQLTPGRFATITLPYAATLPEGVKAYQYSGTNGDGVVVEEVQTLEAGHSYVIRYEAQTAETTVDAVFAATDAAVAAFTAPAAPQANGLFGSTDKYTVGENDGDIYMLNTTDNTFHKTTVGSWSSPFRACLRLSAARQNMPLIIGGGQADGISQTEAQSRTKTIYNLRGQRVSADKLTKGVYIIDGKKTVIK